MFQCPHGLELLRLWQTLMLVRKYVSMPSRAWVVTRERLIEHVLKDVSMPSRAWVVTIFYRSVAFLWYVSMPSRAWVVTLQGSRGASAQCSCLYLIPVTTQAREGIETVQLWNYCRNAYNVTTQAREGIETCEYPLDCFHYYVTTQAREGIET